jgi:hypothetical protein
VILRRQPIPAAYSVLFVLLSLLSVALGFEGQAFYSVYTYRRCRRGTTIISYWETDLCRGLAGYSFPYDAACCGIGMYDRMNQISD